MNKKALIGVGAAVVCALGVITFLVARNAGAPDIDASPEPQAIASASPEVTASASPEASASPDMTASPEEEKVYTPTFMYFVSGADDGHDATMVMIDELKKEYGKKVNFDIRNIDDDPKLVENFPVGDGRTPTLIMLNTKNEISNILFNNSKKDELKAAIDAAMK